MIPATISRSKHRCNIQHLQRAIFEAFEARVLFSTTWTGAGGGGANTHDFNAPGNWSNGAPSATNYATFDSSAAVHLTADITVDRIDIDNGEVDLDLTDYNLTVNGDVSIGSAGNSAGLQVQASTVNDHELEATNFNIAADDGAQAYLWGNDSHVVLHARDAFNIATGMDSAGTLSLTFAYAYVDEGLGKPQSQFGGDYNRHAAIIVDTGTLVTPRIHFSEGGEEKPTVNFHGGGRWVAAGISISRADISGEGTIESDVTIAGDVTFTPGTGEPGSSLDIDGDLTLGSSSALSFVNQINQAGQNANELIISGELSLAGSYSTSITRVGSGFIGWAGDEEFPVISAGFISGDFDSPHLGHPLGNTTPTPYTGLFWGLDYSSYYEYTLVLKFVPDDYGGYRGYNIMGGNVLTSQAAAAPTSVTAAISTAELSQGIVVSWTPGSDNAVGFEIQRKTNDGEWENIHTADANATDWLDDSVNQGYTYTYRVRAQGEDDLFSEYTEMSEGILY